MATNLDDVMDRLAKIELRMVDDHFRKICRVTVDVALAKLETSNREQVERLGGIVYSAQSKMNSTIYKNGLASKEQRQAVSDQVVKLTKRLANHEITLARMESGLKQIELFEERLISVIRTDKEDFELRWGILEDSPKALRKHWTTMEQMHTITRGQELNLARVVREVQAFHSARLINLEAKESIIDFLINEVAKLTNVEYLGTTSSEVDKPTPVKSPAWEWISRVRYSHGLSPFTGLHAEIGAIPMDGPQPIYCTEMVLVVTTPLTARMTRKRRTMRRRRWPPY